MPWRQYAEADAWSDFWISIRIDVATRDVVAQPGGFPALSPADVDAVAALVEEVQGVHPHGDGQRMSRRHGGVRREPDGQLGGPAGGGAPVAEGAGLVYVAVPPAPAPRTVPAPAGGPPPAAPPNAPPGAPRGPPL